MQKIFIIYFYQNIQFGFIILLRDMRECKNIIIRVFTSCKSKTNPMNELNEDLKKGTSYKKMTSLRKMGLE